MVDWHQFTPSDFEYDFDRDKLDEHGVTFDEAVECFFSDFQIRRNKKYRDRYQLLGRTLGGRKVQIIFQLKMYNVVASSRDGHYEKAKKKTSIQKKTDPGTNRPTGHDTS